MKNIHFHDMLTNQREWSLSIHLLPPSSTTTTTKLSHVNETKEQENFCRLRQAANVLKNNFLFLFALVSSETCRAIDMRENGLLTVFIFVNEHFYALEESRGLSRGFYYVADLIT